MDITPTGEESPGAPANGEQSVATCRWAAPTLFFEAPYWFEAEQSAWTCVRDTAPRVLGMTDECAGCPRWGVRLDETAFHDGKPEG